MDPLLEAEARLPIWVRAILVQIDLPDGTACFTDGGFVYYDSGDGSECFWGRHPTYGVLSGLSGLNSGTGSQTTRPDLQFQPKDGVAAALLADPLNQGSRVRIWRGGIERSTGLLIGEPSLLFDGIIDRPRNEIGRSWSLTIECGTESARQLEPNADWKLNHAVQTAIWSGDDGCKNVPRVINAARSQEWRT